jgi:hypothetical protein
MKLVKPIIAMLLAASAAGCLIETEQLAGPHATPESQAAKYDASWYKSYRWTGEYPSGFATTKSVTVKIRETLDPDAPKSISCALRKGATYHPWNAARVASDQLEFVTFSTILTFEAQKDMTVDLERMSDDADVDIEFHKGDRWFLLAPVQEDIYAVRFGDTDYVASGYYLANNSAQVGGKRAIVVDEWMKLKCANGAVGWIRYHEIVKAPGFSRYSTDNYGHAYDEGARPKSGSSK